MKFINYLESISGVAIYPLFSLLVFFLFFAALLLFVFKANKNYIRELERIPIEQDTNHPFVN